MLRAAPSAGADVLVGPGDDAAVLGDGTVVSVDTLVEGVHWDDRLRPADVGWKCVAVSVSDVAVTGGRPEWLLIALSLPRPLDEEWVEGFASGVAAACARFDLALVGGDTTRAPDVRVVSTTVGGRLVAAPITRSGARAGDDVWVSGTLGLAGAGWMLEDPPAAALAALRRPEPRVALALALAGAGVPSAAMDLSDGLAADLPRLCLASGVGARIEPEHIPAGGLLEHALVGGDDYELLFTASPRRREEVAELASTHGVVVSRIGRIVADRGLRLGAAPWPAPAFAHFEGAA